MVGPGICVLCLANTYAFEVHGYLLPNMYLFIADLTNPELDAPSLQSMEGHLQTSMEVCVDNNNNDAKDCGVSIYAAVTDLLLGELVLYD